MRIMKTKEIATVTVAGTPYQIEYDTLEGLAFDIFKQLFEAEKQLADTSVTLADGRKFTWDATLAHYCFAKGRITESTLVEMLLA